MCGGVKDGYSRVQFVSRPAFGCMVLGWVLTCRSAFPCGRLGAKRCWNSATRRNDGPSHMHAVEPRLPWEGIGTGEGEGQGPSHGTFFLLLFAADKGRQRVLASAHMAHIECFVRVRKPHRRGYPSHAQQRNIDDQNNSKAPGQESRRRRASEQMTPGEAKRAGRFRTAQRSRHCGVTSAVVAGMTGSLHLVLACLALGAVLIINSREPLPLEPQCAVTGNG